MPDTWTILKANSSLGSGDAWEHLENQEGGSGSGTNLILIDGLKIEMTGNSYGVEIENPKIEAYVSDNAVGIEIDSNKYDIEVEDV